MLIDLGRYYIEQENKIDKNSKVWGSGVWSISTKYEEWGPEEWGNGERGYEEWRYDSTCLSILSATGSSFP